VEKASGALAFAVDTGFQQLILAVCWRRMPASRVLIVRLPCHKVFPTGPLYLLSALNRGTPRPRLRMIDLALCDPADHLRLVREAVAKFRPDAIAFSWRDMQIFSP
jgi:hypothetical protein